MRRNTSILALAFGLVLFLAGCGRSPSPGQATLVFQHADLLADSGSFAKLFEQFERDNPDIKVKAEPMPGSPAQQRQAYAGLFKGKSAHFDLCALPVTCIAEFARAGWLKDLSQEFPGPERNEFFQGAIEAATDQARLYALPWWIDAGVLYYRKDLLDQQGSRPPEAWIDLIRIATNAPNTNLYGFVWAGRGDENQVCAILEFFWGNGGDILRDNKVVVDSPENRQTLAFTRNLLTKYRISPELVQVLSAEECRKLFAQGKVLFLRDWSHAWKSFEQEGSAMKGKVGVTILPHFPNHDPAAALDGWLLAINANSRHAPAAVRLLKFLVSHQAQKTLALACEMNPSRRKLYEDPELLQARPATASLYNIFLHARSRPVLPAYAPFSEFMQMEFAAVLSRQRKPEDALGSIQTQLERILQESAASSTSPAKSGN